MNIRRAFVIAMECEADAVRPSLGDGDVLLVSGIGKVNAAAATQKAISEYGATHVFNIGLAGGFGRFMRPGDVYEIESAVEYDFDLHELDGRGIGTHDEYDTPYFYLATNGRFPSAVLATGDRFKNGESDRALITEVFKATVRDMEGAAVAHICKRNDVPCSSLKCITNVIGCGSMTGQYESNREKCLVKLNEATREYLSGLSV